MDRHPWSGVIAVLDRESVDGRTIPSDVATAWKLSDKAPVALIDQATMTIVGTVESLAIEGVGILRASGFAHDEPIESGSGLAVVLGKAEYQAKPQSLTVKSAELRAVWLTATPAWAECLVD